MVAPKSKQDSRLESMRSLPTSGASLSGVFSSIELWSMVTRPRQSLEFEFAHTEAWHTLDSDLDYA